MPLITQTSFRTHQDTSEKYGRRIAFSAWYSLNTCVPGTKAARTLEDKISHRTPDFSSQAVRLKDSETIIGFVPVLFPLVVEAAVQRQEFIPNMGPTATGFLLDLAEVVQAELDASE